MKIRKDLVSTKSSDDGRNLSRSYLESRNVILSDSVTKWFYLCLITFLIWNTTATICMAAEKISPDLIKFQGTSWEADSKQGNIFIGTLQNISGKDLEFIGLRCAFYDANQAQLDHGVATVRDIGKNGVSNFKFYPPAPLGTVTATIIEVDVYAK